MIPSLPPTEYGSVSKYYRARADSEIPEGLVKACRKWNWFCWEDQAITRRRVNDLLEITRNETLVAHLNRFGLWVRMVGTVKAEHSNESVKVSHRVSPKAYNDLVWSALSINSTV